MYIECPKCLFDNDIDSEDIPPRACDDEWLMCCNCSHEFEYGWVAELEVRNSNFD